MRRMIRLQTCGVSQAASQEPIRSHWPGLVPYTSTPHMSVGASGMTLTLLSWVVPRIGVVCHMQLRRGLGEPSAARSPSSIPPRHGL